MNRADFVNSIYQAALAAGLTDAAARVTASQAAVESNYGNAAPGNNFFGIKAGSNWNGDTQRLMTHEVVDGKRVAVQQTFRAYPTPEAGIADRVSFMARAFPGFNEAPSVGSAYDALANGRYGSYQTESRANYESSLNSVNSQYLGGTPVPPADIPSNADPINGGALQNPALMLPYPAPAPLTPPTGNVFGGRLPPAAMNGVDRLVPGQVTQPPTDFTRDPSGAFDPRLSSMLAPQVPRVDPIGTGPGSFAALQALLPQTAPPLPINRPATPVQAAPVPMAAPSLAAPVAGPPAAANLVRLPSGKMVAPGTYPSTDGSKTTFTVANDGRGNAVVTPNRIGIMAGIGPGTVAGGVVGQKLAEAVPQVQASLGQAGQTIATAASAAKDQAAGLLGNIGNGLAGLFSGGKPPSVPAPSSSPSFLPSGQSSATPIAPQTSYVPPKTVTLANPAYAQWQAQYGDPATSYRDAYQTAAAYGDPAASYRDGYQASMAAPAIPAAPPKYLTKTIPGVPVMPAMLPPFMRPVLPQSSLFLNNPVAQATSKSNVSGLLQILSGAGNNYGYITPAPGMTQAQTHDALMAQQNQSPTVNYNGGAQTTTASGTPLQNIASGQRWAAAFM